MLRVDSPGGSVTGSETIWREVARARERGKPVVASMGAVAASGGYYVAMGADAIVANPGHHHRFDRGDHRQAGGARPARSGSASGRTPCAPTPTPTPGRSTRPSPRSSRPIVEAEADLFYTDFVRAGRRGPQHDDRGRGCRCAGPGVDRRRRPANAAWSTNSVDLRTAVRRAKVLAGLDADTEVRTRQLSGLVAAGHGAPAGLSQPAAASLPDALGGAARPLDGRDRGTRRAVAERRQRAVAGAPRGSRLLAGRAGR